MEQFKEMICFIILPFTLEKGSEIRMSKLKNLVLAFALCLALFGAVAPDYKELHN